MTLLFSPRSLAYRRQQKNAFYLSSYAHSRMNVWALGALDMQLGMLQKMIRKA